MRRWFLSILGVSLAASLVAVPLIVKPQPPAPTASASPSTSASGSPAPAQSTSRPSADAGVDSDAPNAADGSVFSLLADGGLVPNLPAGAPKRVAFGAILFRYQGAQGVPIGERTRAEALELAQSVLPDAREDFNKAVKKGDPGSVADAGVVPRGVLEKRVEYVLFSLDSGELHAEPLDTPRGYWLVKRLK